MSENPYQSPTTDSYTAESTGTQTTAQDTGSGAQTGMWRDGNILVMHKRAPLPARCVKSNKPTTRKLRRDLSWHHPAIFLTILIGLLIYIICALVLRKQAHIEIGLSDEWFARRRKTMMIAWGGVFASIIILFVGIAVVQDYPIGGFMIAGSIIAFFVFTFYGLIGAQMVSPKRISDNYVWLKGVCPEYLEGVEPWTYGYSV